MVGVLVITGVGIIGVMQHGLGIADAGNSDYLARRGDII